jgi:hypothetical protein
MKNIRNTKRSIYLLTGLLIFSTAYSQEKSTIDNNSRMPAFGDFTIGVSPILIGNTANSLQLGGSGNVQLYLSKWFSLEADLSFARNYFHLGPGIIAIPFWLFFQLDNEDDEGNSLNRETFQSALIIAAVTILSLEHFSVHFPVAEEAVVSPYISLLRYRSSYNSETNKDDSRIAEQFCFASGIKLDKYSGRFVVSPFAEYNIGYADHISGFMAGVTLSFRVK